MSRDQVVESEGVIFARLPIELLLQIFNLCGSFRAAITLSETCRYLRLVHQTHLDRIYLDLAPRCLPCHDDALALARLQVADDDRHRLGEAMRRNHRMVFRSARHALARQNEWSVFKQAYDRPVLPSSELEALPDELDEACLIAIAIDYAINRLLIAPPEERARHLGEIAAGSIAARRRGLCLGAATGTDGGRWNGVSLKRLQDSITMKVYSYSAEEKALYLRTEYTVWADLLLELIAKKYGLGNVAVARTVEDDA